jgi:YVTN family beta-propeller protein
VRAALLTLALALLLAPSAFAATRDVLYVGNNWDGTADVIDPTTFERITRLNIVPDKDERMAEIQGNPRDLGYFVAIRQFIGEGNDQFVDDMFSSPDGRFLYVSRPSFADVIALDLTTRKIVWRTRLEGQRSDHMAISPDGRQLVVSDSTANKAHRIDTETGRITGAFPSGDSPHENNFSLDGTRIFHASIGLVYTPLDRPLLDTSKGDRWFQIVDAKTLEVVKRIDMGEKLREAGFTDMSAAVRPMALSPDERFLYFQVSFFHGFVEYDLQEDKVLRLAYLPVSEEAQKLQREEYLLDSAHHGLAMSPDGAKLCVAGTMSDYLAIVDRSDFSVTVPSHGKKPYWSTNSADGKYCFISYSGDDAIAVVDYATERAVARVPVGDHPQRMRMGKALVEEMVKSEPRLSVSVTPRRVRARKPVTVRVRVTADGQPVEGARVMVGGLRARTDAAGRASVRKRRGFMRVRRYGVRASAPGHQPGVARLRALRRR